MTANASEDSANKPFRWLYLLTALVSLVGLGDALYLTVQHLTGESLRCTLISGCSEVLSSPYAQIGSIPLAAVGAFAYFTVFSLAILAAFGYRFVRVPLTLLVAVMFVMSLWLLYLQAFVIRHFCQYCLLSAAVTTVLTVIVLFGWRRGSSRVTV
jgi:Predicted membrane protein